jgi:isoleucyl-tRNA synthetase
MLERHGADALRLYLIDSPVVRAQELRFSETGVRDVVRTVLHAAAPRPRVLRAVREHRRVARLRARAPTRRWPSARSSTAGSCRTCSRWSRPSTPRWSSYHLYAVVPPVLGFIEDLTNWYIRLSRRRFWRGAGEDPADKDAAYATLYEVLVTFAQVLAPFLPFAAESLYQSLVVATGSAAVGADGAPLDSVHLTDWPRVDPSRIDRALEAAVHATRDVVSLGRRLRERTRLKTRQPLRRLTVVHHDDAVRDAVTAHAALVRDELNVRAVEVRADGHELATVTCKANFKTLGKRFGKDMKLAAAAIEAFGPAELAALDAGSTVEVLGQPVGPDDVVVRRESRGDLVIEVDGGLIVAYDTAVDDELLAEGLAREVVSTVQRLRKEQGFAVADRVVVTVTTDDDALAAAVRAHLGFVQTETLSTTSVVDGPGDDVVSSVRGDHRASFAVRGG